MRLATRFKKPSRSFGHRVNAALDECNLGLSLGDRYQPVHRGRFEFMVLSLRTANGNEISKRASVHVSLGVFRPSVM